MKRFQFSLMLLFITTLLLRAQTYDGYTLYALQNGVTANLVDMSGSNYHTWSFNSSSKTGYSSYLLKDGTLVRTIARTDNYFTGTLMCGGVQKVDWDGNVIWDYKYSSTQYCSHHDICPMPNGNVLLIAYELKSAAEVTQAGSSQSIIMWPDKIVEIQPVGSDSGIVVWEWHAWDHLCQNYSSSKDNYVISIVQHPELLNINYKTAKDWLHMNGIDYNATLNQITFSSHNFSEVFVVDHSTTTVEAVGHTGGNSGKGGDILYRWGNPAAYSASGTANFNTVHDAHWVPADCPRANSLVGFNNQGGAGGKSCIDIFSPPYAGYNYSLVLGSAYEPATYSFRHTYSGSPTPNNSNSQQLPNGNMLVCIGLSGYIYEIDSNQTVVWSKNTGGMIAQAFRYGYDYIEKVTENSNISLKINTYPNPTRGIINIETNIPANKNFEINIYDVFGNNILQSKNIKIIDLSGFNNGIYFLSVKSDNTGIVTKKITLIK